MTNVGLNFEASVTANIAYRQYGLKVIFFPLNSLRRMGMNGSLPTKRHHLYTEVNKYFTTHFILSV